MNNKKYEYLRGYYGIQPSKEIRHWRDHKRINRKENNHVKFSYPNRIGRKIGIGISREAPYHDGKYYNRAKVR